MEINYFATKKAALILRAVNNKLRQRIINLISEKKRMTVTEIYVQLRIEQSVASQHLAILRQAKIVLTEREGKFIHYKVNETRIKFIETKALELGEEKTA